MRALRFHAAGDLRVEEVEELRVGRGTAKVRVGHCGICGTDVEEFRRGPRVLPRAGRPHPLTGAEPPLVLGHEIAGEIVELGDDAPPGLELGRLVAVDPLLSCGACPPCLSGARHLCRIGGAIGLIGGGGGFAEYVVVAAERLHPLPPGIGTELGALVEPIAVARHGLERARFAAGQTALVIGAGPIGLGATASARAMGAARVVVAVRRPGRRAELARLLGADAVVGAGGRGRGLLEELDGEEFDVVLDAAGTGASLPSALRAARRGGVVVNLALWEETVAIDPNRLLAREVSLVGSMAYEGEFPLVIDDLDRGRLGGVEEMISGIVSLDDAVRDGFEALASSRTETVKVLVSP